MDEFVQRKQMISRRCATNKPTNLNQEIGGKRQNRGSITRNSWSKNQRSCYSTQHSCHDRLSHFNRKSRSQSNDHLGAARVSDDQKHFRYEIAKSNRNWCENDRELLNRLICFDESWVEFYTPLQGHETLSWVETGSRVTRLPRQGLDERKILFAIGTDVRGIAFWKTYEEDITLNGVRYKHFLE